MKFPFSFHAPPSPPPFLQAKVKVREGVARTVPSFFSENRDRDTADITQQKQQILTSCLEGVPY